MKMHSLVAVCSATHTPERAMASWPLWYVVYADLFNSTPYRSRDAHL